MALQIDPENWQSVNVVQIDSDAPTNKLAIEEIEAWAAENAFVRTDEYHLRQIIKRNGQHVFRGICYRITEEYRESAAATVKEIADNAARHPVRRVGGDERR